MTLFGIQITYTVAIYISTRQIALMQLYRIRPEKDQAWSIAEKWKQQCNENPNLFTTVQDITDVQILTFELAD